LEVSKRIEEGREFKAQYRKSWYERSSHMKVVPELRDAVVRMDEQRKVPGKEITTVRIDLRTLEQLHHEAKAEGFTVHIDEPKERGGTATGCSPLHHFVIGAASCFLTQMARLTIVKNLKIDSMEILARAHADRKSREFLDMIYDIKMTGSENKEEVIKLLHESEALCFVHQTLKKVIPLTSNLTFNGELLTTSALGPPKG
jgi:uncharacterized OsmC-like protein